MSSIATGCCPDMGYCEALVVGIDTVNGINNTSLKSTPLGTTQALLDGSNTSQASYEVQDGEVVRKIRVKRIPRGTYTEAEDQVSCDITTTTTINEQCIEVLQSANISFEVLNSDMERYCREAFELKNGGSGTTFFEQHLQFINSKMNALRERINRKVISLLLANIGINITTGNNLSTALSMIDSVTGAKLEVGIQELMYQMTDNEVYGTPLVIGHGNFDKFNTSANFGCCNQFGLDWNGMMQSAPYRYYRDVSLSGLTGNPNQFLVLSPGTTQFVFFNNLGIGKGSLDRRHGNVLYGLIPDPYYPGVMYDVAIEETNCKDGFRAPAWIISLYLHFDVAFVPLNAFSTGDRLKLPGGISNGVFTYEALSV